VTKQTRFLREKALQGSYLCEVNIENTFEKNLSDLSKKVCETYDLLTYISQIFLRDLRGRLEGTQPSTKLAFFYLEAELQF